MSNELARDRVEAVRSLAVETTTHLKQRLKERTSLDDYVDITLVQETLKEGEIIPQQDNEAKVVYDDWVTGDTYVVPVAFDGNEPRIQTAYTEN